MVNKNWFKKIKNGAILINTSRGEVIVEKEIIKSIVLNLMLMKNQSLLDQLHIFWTIYILKILIDQI